MGTSIALKGKNEYQTIKAEAIYTSIQQEFSDFMKRLENEQAVWLEDIFNTVIGNRLTHVGYMDVSRFLDYPMARQVCALEWKRKLSCIYQLFMVRKAGTDNSQTAIFDEFWKKYSASRKPLSGKEQEAVLYWFFTRHSGRLRNRKALLIAMIEQFCPEDAKRKWELSGNILSNHIYCEILPVSSLEEYVDVVAGFQEECRGRKLYYRGHADVNYDLLPSIKRYKNWMENEDRMYHELLVRCPNDFRDCKCHLDYLVEMQHYGLPTRLLDITESPMVALYFACCDSAKKTGEVIMFPVEQHEVKYFHSDTVAVLAALSTRTWEYREELRKSVDAGDKRAAERLLRQLAREIKSKNPAFEPEIHIEDVTRNLFVSPVKSNQRIVKQEGAFIICGLDTEGPGRNSLQELRIREHESNPDSDEKGRIVVCVVENKKAILEQLDQFGINQAALFPEIDQVTGYIKGQYL